MTVSLYGYPEGEQARPVRLAPTIEEEWADPRFCNWANPRARSILALLGFEGEYLEGSATVAEWRRALMVARSRIESGRVEGLTWDPSVEFGAPRVDGSGVTVLRPVRLVSGGCSGEYLAAEIDRVAAFVEAVAAMGAVRVAWY